MIERIILLRLKAGVSREALAPQLARAVAVIPRLARASVGLPADASAEKSWDLSLVLAFADQFDHDAVLASPEFRDCADGLIASNSQVVKGWSFADVR